MVDGFSGEVKVSFALALALALLMRLPIEISGAFQFVVYAEGSKVSQHMRVKEGEGPWFKRLRGVERLEIAYPYISEKSRDLLNELYDAIRGDRERTNGFLENAQGCRNVEVVVR